MSNLLVAPKRKENARNPRLEDTSRALPWARNQQRPHPLGRCYPNNVGEARGHSILPSEQHFTPLEGNLRLGMRSLLCHRPSVGMQ